MSFSASAAAQIPCSSSCTSLWWHLWRKSHIALAINSYLVLLFDHWYVITC